MSSRGVFKRKLYAAKNKFLMDIEVTYMAKNFQNLKQILKDYLWTKKIRFGFPHFLFVQIEFLHAHVTQDPSLPDVFYCSLIDWLNQASPLDQCIVNKDFIIFIKYINSTNLILNKADPCLDCHQGYCSYPFHAQRCFPQILPILFWLTSSTQQSAMSLTSSTKHCW